MMLSYPFSCSHTHENILKDQQKPEMQRVGLESLILQILILDLGDPVCFLGKSLDPPSAALFVNSVKLLEKLGAVECAWVGDEEEVVMHMDDSEDCTVLSVKVELTPLGFHLAALPVEPRVGKILLYGAMFGCVEAALTIASAMASKNPFMSSFDQRWAAEEAKRRLAVHGSDFLAVLVAFTGWKGCKSRKAAQAFLQSNCLSFVTLNQMNDLRKQYASLLADIGFVPSDFNLNQHDAQLKSQFHESNISMLMGVLCAGKDALSAVHAFWSSFSYRVPCWNCCRSLSQYYGRSARFMLRFWKLGCWRLSTPKSKRRSLSPSVNGTVPGKEARGSLLLLP